MWDKRNIHSIPITYLFYVILMISLTFGPGPSRAQAATWTVPAGDDIQAVIDGAADLDTVKLLEGIHSPEVNEAIKIIEKNLTIIGDPEATATVAVQGNGNQVFNLWNATVTLKNLTIRDGDSDASGGGIYQYRGKLTVKNCEITQNGSVDTDEGGAIRSEHGELKIIGCEIHDNQAFTAPAISCKNCVLTIQESHIHHNTGLETDPCYEADSEASGGGVNSDTSEVSISNSIIEHNTTSFGGGLGLLNSSLDLTSSFIKENTSRCPGGGLMLDKSRGTISSTEISLNNAGESGGGIHAEDECGLDITDSTISGNQAGTEGGGIHTYNNGSFYITDSTIAGNQAGSYGGGIDIFASYIFLLDTLISDNEAQGEEKGVGGGIFLGKYATVTILKSTLSGNMAQVAGGGIWMEGDNLSVDDLPLPPDGGGSMSAKFSADPELDEPTSATETALKMENSTVSGNTAAAFGGGLSVGGTDAVNPGVPPVVYLDFSTITNNSSPEGGGVYSVEGSTYHLRANIIAGNIASDGPDWWSQNTVESLSSYGGNLIGNNGHSNFEVGEPNPDGDLVGAPDGTIDPELGALADNGGPTRTHSPASFSSPAVDLAVDGPDQDQRGYGRPYPEAGACDSGAFEYFGSADLTLSKTVDNASPLLWSLITYTLSLANGGPDPARWVVVTDLLPSGLTYVSDDAGGDYDPNTGIWTVGYLDDSDTTQLNITARVDQVGSITNSAKIESATTDASPASDSVEIIAVPPTGATLVLTKTVDETEPVVGNNVWYTLTVANAGPDPAENIRVMDLLPTGLSWVSDDASGAYDHVTGEWDVGGLIKDADQTLHITAEVIRAGVITNSASAYSSTDDTNSPTAQVNITATETKDVNLGLTKTVDNSTPEVGDNVVYTLTVTNYGSDQGENVRVSDLLPTGLSYQSHSGSGGYDDATGLWMVGDLNGLGGWAALQITARVTQGGTITNTATAFCDTPGSNSPVAGVDIKPTEQFDVTLALTKTVNDNQPEVGDRVTYTLTIRNDGTDPAAGVVVGDRMPMDVTYHGDDSGGSYRPDRGIWDVGVLAPSAGAVLHIEANVTRPGTFTNTATAFCLTPGSNSPVARVDITATEHFDVTLGLTKTVNDNQPEVGDRVTYALTIRNDGTDFAKGVKVRDLLPTGLVYYGDDSGGKYTPATGIWDVGVMEPSADAVLHIEVDVALPGTITNMATAFCDIPGSNSPVARVDITAAEHFDVTLGLTKTVSDNQPEVGDRVTYSLTVRNDGTDPAAGVTVSDLLPTGLTYYGDDSGGGYTPATGIWDVGTLAASGSAVLQIEADVTQAGTITNTATAFCGVPGSNSPVAGVDITVTEHCDVTLGLTKTVSESQPEVGDRVTYTLTVRNDGSDPASGVVVSDLLPTGVTYYGDDSGDSYTPATGIWDVGTLAASGNAVLQIEADVTLPGTITNTVTAFCGVPGANSPSAGVDIAVPQPQGPALYLMKIVNENTPVVGDQVTYTLTVSYLGTIPGEGVRVTDLLPDGLTYVSDDSSGDYDHQTGLWTVGNMQQLDIHQLNITALVTRTGTITNTATAASDTPGVTPASAGVQILAGEEVTGSLVLTKTVDNITPELGAQVTYTLVVANQGQEAVKDIIVSDILPTGLAYVSNDSGGSFDPDTGVWTVGRLEPAETRQLKIVAQTTQVGIITNTATAFSTTEGSIPASGSAYIGVRGATGKGGGGGGCFIRILK